MTPNSLQINLIKGATQPPCRVASFLKKMIQEIKKEFFGYRNGVVAERLRAAGDPHSVIMGCQLADIIAIADHYGKNALLAQSLWNNVNHRECRIAAPMLYPIEKMTIETATAWCLNVESVEIADVLCHRLMRHLPFATTMWQHLHTSVTPLVRYTAYRLLLNLLLMKKIEPDNIMRKTIEKEISTATPPLLPLLHSIREEL